jgi:hypothetical protein
MAAKPDAGWVATEFVRRYYEVGICKSAGGGDRAVPRQQLRAAGS